MHPFDLSLQPDESKNTLRAQRSLKIPRSGDLEHIFWRRAHPHTARDRAPRRSFPSGSDRAQGETPIPEAHNPSNNERLRAVVAERDELRVRLCQAEISRQLLPVALGNIDLAHALASLNATLKPITRVEITALVADNLDAALALGTDLPDPTGRAIIERWQAALGANREVHTTKAAKQLVIPAVHNRRAIGYATAAGTTEHIDLPVGRALQQGLGETIHAARTATERA